MQQPPSLVAAQPASLAPPQNPVAGGVIQPQGQQQPPPGSVTGGVPNAAPKKVPPKFTVTLRLEPYP